MKINLSKYWETPLCTSFFVLCFCVSIPSVFPTTYFEWFNSEMPHEYWWQKVTMPFQHGAKGMPIAILAHFTLNMILLNFCGRAIEQILGLKRFLFITLAAWLWFGLIQFVSGIWVNGSSGIIWAYSPFLLKLVEWGKRGKRNQQVASNATFLLIIMWGMITIAMGFVPLWFNPNQSLWHTFFFGNLYYFTATTLGFAFFRYWSKSIKKRKTTIL